MGKSNFEEQTQRPHPKVSSYQDWLAMTLLDFEKKDDGEKILKIWNFDCLKFVVFFERKFKNIPLCGSGFR